MTTALMISADVTQRHLTEQSLRKRELQLAEAQALTHIGNWEWDLAADRICRSAEACRILGISPESPAAGSVKDGMERVDPDDRARLQGIIDAGLRNHQPFECEFRIVRPDG